MSNRINLTQFDAITKGQWEVIELPGGGIDIGVRYANHGHRPVVNFTQRMGEQVKQIERDVADMNAIAAVPELIAELKRCYAMLDAIAYEVAPCSECGGHREEEGLFHDCQNYCRCEEFNDASE